MLWGNVNPSQPDPLQFPFLTPLICVMLSPTQFNKLTYLLTIPLYLILITEIPYRCLQHTPRTHTIFILNMQIFALSLSTTPCLLTARWYSPFPWALVTPVMLSNIEAPGTAPSTKRGARCGNLLPWPTSCAVCKATQDTAGAPDCHTNDSYSTCSCYIQHRYTYIMASTRTNSSWPAWWSPSMKWFHPRVREELQK